VREAVSFVLFCVAMSLATSAMAQKIAVARTAGDQRITNRVNAELSALGFEVELVPETRSTEPSSLRQIATEHGAVAGLRASPSKTGIELWIVNPATGATAYEEVVTIQSGRNDELLALRSVEVLRARLLKLGVLSSPPPAPAPIEPARPIAPASPVPPPPPRTQLLTADLGLAYTLETSALSNYASARFGLTLSPMPILSVSSFALLPVEDSEVSESAGTASVNAKLFGLGGDAHLRWGRLGASLGAGALLAVLSVTGEAEPPYQGQHDRLFAAVPFVRLGGSAAVTDWLGLNLELLAGLATPPTVVRVDLNEVAEWGRPLLTASLTLQLGVLAHRPNSADRSENQSVARE
jgi:hypothetical protein